MKTKKLDNMIIFMIAIFCLLTSFFNAGINIAFADNITYSNVLEDLQKDEAFNVEDYPVIENDYSLNVIQIAESVNNELFVYVYQPSADKDIVATSISMTTEYHTINNFALYNLTYLNSEGVFYKYVVNDFKVSKDSTRIYEITEIFRAWNENYDNETGNDNIINEVSYPVAKQFTFVDIDNQTSLLVSDLEYITVTDKYVGFVRYQSGANFWGTTDSCDSHFVAFSTDKKIDNLLEADVYFQIQKVDYNVNGNDWTFGDIKDNYSYMTDTDAVFYQSDKNFWYNYSFEWQRVQTVDDFISGEDFSKVYKGALFNVKSIYNMDETSKNYIKKQEWVLRFYESEYTYEPGYYGGIHHFTNVSNVSVLRLKFETDGVVYNLGVIDNKQSGDSVPDNKVDVEYSISDYLKFILIALAILSLLVALAPLLPTILTFLGKCVVWIFKAIWWIITLPFEIFKDDDKRRK